MFCEKLKCKTAMEACINRQQVASKPPTNQMFSGGVRFPQCRDCEQGRGVMEKYRARGKKKVKEPDIEELKGKVAKPMTATEIEERHEKVRREINQKIRHENFQRFCDKMASGAPVIESTPPDNGKAIVEKTRQEPPTESWAQQEAQIIREALEEQQVAPPYEPTTHPLVTYPEDPGTGEWRNHVVTVDFTRRPDLLQWLEEMAIEDMRSVDQELAWLVKQTKELEEQRRGKV